MTSIYRALAGSPKPNEISNGYSKPRVTLDSYHSTLSLCDSHFRVSSSRVSPDSYHSTLSLGDNHIHMSSARVSPDSYHSTLSLGDNHVRVFHLLGTKLFGLHFEPLISTQKFLISPRVSYTHTEISEWLPGSLTPTQKFQDISPGLLHPHRNSGYLPGSLTPSQKFRISHWVSYIHAEIQDRSPGLLHPHRNSGSLPRSLTPIQKFGISLQVSYTLTEIRDSSPGLLHPYRN